MSTISNLIFKNAKHYVTSPFGKRAPMKTSAGTTASFHNGTDYGTDGKKIAQYAIEDGYVFAAAKATDGANYVWVIYPRVKLAMLHYHLDSYKVKAGQKVVKGTLLGYTGMTGKATGVHLHLGIRDISKLNASQINAMNWTNLQACSYVDPEKVSYKEPTAEVSKPADTTTSTKYTVKKGDTLTEIAKKYGTTVEAIMKANPNHKNANLINVGDVFVIPSAAKPTTTPATKTVAKGAMFNLKKAPVYASSSIAKSSGTLTGTYYAYDGIVANGRIRVTNAKTNVGRLPLTKYVTGWVKI